MNVNEWLLFEECHVPCIKPTTATAPNAREIIYGSIHLILFFVWQYKYPQICLSMWHLFTKPHQLCNG